MIELRRIELGASDLAPLQALLLRCADFVEAMRGHPPRDDEAKRLFGGLPAGRTLADQQVLGVNRDGGLIGVVELLAGHPSPTDWYIGLMLLSPEVRGAGLGTALVREVAARVLATGGRALHLIAHEHNPRAIAFWQRQGFALVDRRVQDLGTKKNLVLKMVRAL
jgi:ribosomal protein S18 acetylase RimI-like enzyme